MTDSIWLVVDQVWCDRMKTQAKLLEERVYADESTAGPGASFQVRARKC